MKKHWRLEGLEAGGLCLMGHEVLTACGRVVDEDHGTRDYFRLSCQTCKTSRIARRGIVTQTKKDIYDLMSKSCSPPCRCEPEKTFTAGQMTYMGPVS